MKELVNSLGRRSKQAAKSAVKQVIGRLPPPKDRLSGKLAVHGGKPVRDRRYRPWPPFPSGSLKDWHSTRPVIEKLFRSGQEGLPQTLAKQFASEWAKYCGTRHALLVPHGTDALRLGIAAALDHDGLDFGGEIIVPNISFVASANAALDRRVGVALVDVDARTLNLDPQRVEEAIVPGRTRAIMAVHLFGQPADMTTLKAIAAKHSLLLIEDAAQAHGAIHELGKVGSIGDVAAFSFQGYKNLPAGEGGALVTNDSALFERAYQMHNVGRRLVGGLRWAHESLGWNCRPTEYIAAVLLHRFRFLEAQQQTRWERFQLLRNAMGDLQSVEILGLGSGVVRHGVHMFVMKYRSHQCGGLEAADFIKALKAEGIPLGRAYEKTLAQQPALGNLAAKRPEYVRLLPSPVAEDAVQRLLYLPHQLFLASEEEVLEVAAAFKKVEAHYRRAATVAVLGSTPVSGSTTVAAPAPAVVSTVVSGGAPTLAKRLRVGIVGAGFMGQQHAQTLSKIDSFILAGISDVQPEAARQAAKKFATVMFETPQQLFASGEIDVVIIATPHWQHADLAEQALRKGLHVICEKPLAVTVGQADRVLAVAEEHQKLFAVVHQTRLEPSYKFAKQLLESGELGKPYRCTMIESAWRTDAYYRASSWRGTWKGEGGGVLLNQAPHVLDRYAWLCGMPATVSAVCDTNLHPIEVEDTVSVILKHASGMHGFIHVNTTECPPVSQTVICCDRGKIVLDRGTVTLNRLKTPILDATRKDARAWGDLEYETRKMEFPYGDVMDALLSEFYENFRSAFDGRSKLTCDALDARNTVELANAILLSSEKKRQLALPIDRDEYRDFIQTKIGGRSELVAVP